MSGLPSRTLRPNKEGGEKVGNLGVAKKGKIDRCADSLCWQKPL